MNLEVSLPPFKTGARIGGRVMPENTAAQVFFTAATETWAVSPPTPDVLQRATAEGVRGSEGNPQLFGLAMSTFRVSEVGAEYFKMLFDSEIPIAGREGAEILCPWSGGGPMVADSNDEDPVDGAAREAAAAARADMMPRADAALNYALQKGEVELAEWLVTERGANASRPELLAAACACIVPAGDPHTKTLEHFRGNVLPFLTRHADMESLRCRGHAIATDALRRTDNTELFELLLDRLGRGEAYDTQQATALAREFTRGYKPEIAA